MGKTANKQMICEVLMEAAKEDHDIVALCSDSRGIFYTVCRHLSGAVCRNRNRRAESGKHCSRTGKMRKEILCGFSGMLSFDKKL